MEYLISLSAIIIYPHTIDGGFKTTNHKTKKTLKTKNKLI